MAAVVYIGRACALEQLTCRLMQNDPKDGWRKGRNVFSPAIKGISLVIDMVQVLVSWHVDCCPLDPNSVVRAKPKSSRTSGASLSSWFLSSLFTCQQLRPQATSLHARVARRLTITVRMMPFTCMSWPYWPLIWVLAYFSRKFRSVWMPLRVSGTIYHCKSCNSSSVFVFNPHPTPPDTHWCVSHRRILLNLNHNRVFSFPILTEHQWPLLLSLCKCGIKTRQQEVVHVLICFHFPPLAEGNFICQCNNYSLMLCDGAVMSFFCWRWKLPLYV